MDNWKAGRRVINYRCCYGIQHCPQCSFCRDLFGKNNLIQHEYFTGCIIVIINAKIVNINKFILPKQEILIKHSFKTWLVKIEQDLSIKETDFHTRHISNKLTVDKSLQEFRLAGFIATDAMMA